MKCWKTPACRGRARIEIVGRGRAGPGKKANPGRRAGPGFFRMPTPACRGRAGLEKTAGIPANRGYGRGPGRPLSVHHQETHFSRD